MQSNGCNLKTKTHSVFFIFARVLVFVKMKKSTVFEALLKFLLKKLLLV